MKKVMIADYSNISESISVLDHTFKENTQPFLLIHFNEIVQIFIEHRIPFYIHPKCLNMPNIKAFVYEYVHQMLMNFAKKYRMVYIYDVEHNIIYIEGNNVSVQIIEI